MAWFAKRQFAIKDGKFKFQRSNNPGKKSDAYFFAIGDDIVELFSQSKLYNVTNLELIRQCPRHTAFGLVKGYLLEVKNYKGKYKQYKVGYYRNIYNILVSDGTREVGKYTNTPIYLYTTITFKTNTVLLGTEITEQMYKTLEVIKLLFQQVGSIRLHHMERINVEEVLTHIYDTITAFKKDYLNKLISFKSLKKEVK